MVLHVYLQEMAPLFVNVKKYLINENFLLLSNIFEIYFKIIKLILDAFRVTGNIGIYLPMVYHNRKYNHRNGHKISGVQCKIVMHGQVQ